MPRNVLKYTDFCPIESCNMARIDIEETTELRLIDDQEDPMLNGWSVRRWHNTVYYQHPGYNKGCGLQDVQQAIACKSDVQIAADELNAANATQGTWYKSKDGWNKHSETHPLNAGWLLTTNLRQKPDCVDAYETMQ